MAPRTRPATFVHVAAEAPNTGESVDVLGWRLEVIDLDERRIDKVLAMPLNQRVGSPTLS